MEILTLTAEVAQHYLEIIKLADGPALLQGPLTSHIWLRLSPLPYYLFFPIFALFRFHPLTLFYLAALSHIISLVLNYIVVKKVFDKKTALISTLFLTVSPLMLGFLRTPGFYSFIIPLTYLLMLAVWRITRKSKSGVWPAFFLAGLMGTLHAASLIVVPYLFVVFWKTKKLNVKQAIAGLAAFLLPNIPFFLNDAKGGFSMTKNLLLWIPYKLANFITGTTLGLNRTQVADRTLLDIFDYLKTLFLPPNFHWVFGLAIIICISIYFFSKKRPKIENMLFLWLITGLLGLTLHKNPPIHYFLPFLTLPVIFVSKAVAELWNKRTVKLPLSILLVIVTLNLSFIFSKNFLFNKNNLSFDFVPYRDQVAVAELIVNSARGKKYRLARVGPFDNYKGGFKENYEFLLWRMGNRPVEKSSKKYLVVEGKTDPEKLKGMLIIGRFGKVSVYRSRQ